MTKKTLTCIGCPLGCEIEVTFDDSGIQSITGYSCKIGVEYAKKEITNPTRIITSILPVLHGSESMVSVKTSKDLPKDRIFDCMEKLKGVHFEAPIHIGDILVKNICNLGVDIIATKEVKRV